MPRAQSPEPVRALTADLSGCNVGLSFEHEFSARRAPLAEHLRKALLEHEYAIAELRQENEQLRGQLWQLSATGASYGGAAGLEPVCHPLPDPGAAAEKADRDAMGEDQKLHQLSQSEQAGDEGSPPDPSEADRKGSLSSADAVQRPYARKEEDEQQCLDEDEEIPGSRRRSQIASPPVQKPARHSFLSVVPTAWVEESACMRFMQMHFESMTSILILLNTVFLFVQLQQSGKVIGGRLGFAPSGVWPDLETPLYVVEHLFNIVFLLELMIRVCTWKKKYFCGRKGVEWHNMFDMSLVVSASLDLYVIQPFSDALNLSMFRPLRFFRLLRTLRILQLFRSLLPLRILVKAVAASFKALFWSISLLLMIMLMAALFLCQMLSSTLDDESIDEETRKWVYDKYGTSPRAAWTVFELTFSGCWPGYVRTLVEKVSTFYAFFFFIYVIAVIFAMFRVVSALFLKDTLAAAAADAEVAIVERQKQKQAYAKKMMTFFRAANLSGDGFLTRSEFNTMMEDPEVQTWFSIMDVDVHESTEFFELLANADGVVPAQDFVNGIPRLKGQARSQDVVAVRLLSKRIQRSLDELQGSLRDDGVAAICSQRL